MFSIRTTIKLPDNFYYELKNISAKTGICKTDLIRISIADFLKKWGVDV